MSETNRRLDDAIRQVPVPAELAGRLAPEALFDDAAIDRALASIALPSGLADRVRAAAQAEVAGRSGGVIDLARCATPPPAVPPSPRRRRRRLTGLARELGNVAAALGLAGLLATAGIELSRRLEGPAPRIAAARPPTSEQARPGTAARGRPGPASGREVPTQGEQAGADAPDRGLADRGLPASDRSPSHLQDRALQAEPAFGEPTVRGAPIWLGEQTPAPAMITVALPAGLRRPVPRSAAFDLAFEMAYGEAPFVDPAADAALLVDRPPLTLRTDSLDVLLEGWRGRRASGTRGGARVEEVLAAMPVPPELVAATGQAVRLGLHSVRSGRAFAGMPTVLLEVAAYAAEDRARPSESLHTTLIIDQSAAGDPRGWSRICRGLVALARHLGPADRTTVILCGPRPRVAVQDADPATLMAAASSWESLPAAASADLDAAFELAITERLVESRTGTVVVAHGVTLDRGRTRVREALAEWHRALAAADGDSLASGPRRGTRFIVIDPTAPPPAGEDEPTFGRTGLDATAIRRDLIRQVTGRDTLVARHCRLEVRFDPAQVSRYRIVGHRQTAIESLADGPPPSIDLHVGETARVVYEVVPIRPNALGLATAALTWRAPGGADGRLEAVDRDSRDRGDSLPSPHGCELLLATGIGELVGGSPHIDRPRALVASLEAIAADWRKRGDLTAFGTLLVEFLERRAASQRTSR